MYARIRARHIKLRPKKLSNLFPYAKCKIENHQNEHSGAKQEITKKENHKKHKIYAQQYHLTINPSDLKA